MRRITFRLITLGSLGLLLFSLYLNFVYKSDATEFTTVKKNTTDTTTTVKLGTKTASLIH